MSNFQGASVPWVKFHKMKTSAIYEKIAILNDEINAFTPSKYSTVADRNIYNSLCERRQSLIDNLHARGEVFEISKVIKLRKSSANFRDAYYTAGDGVASLLDITLASGDKDLYAKVEALKASLDVVRNHLNEFYLWD